MAYTDILTGLGNRTVFEDELERNRRNRMKTDTIIMIADLNDLKTIKPLTVSADYKKYSQNCNLVSDVKIQQ